MRQKFCYFFIAKLNPRNLTQNRDHKIINNFIKPASRMKIKLSEIKYFVFELSEDFNFRWIIFMDHSYVLMWMELFIFRRGLILDQRDTLFKQKHFMTHDIKSISQQATF